MQTYFQHAMQHDEKRMLKVCFYHICNKGPKFIQYRQLHLSFMQFAKPMQVLEYQNHEKKLQRQS